MVKRHGKRLRNNKKGSIVDILFLALVLAVFAIVVLVGLKIATEIRDRINLDTEIFNTQSIDSANLLVTKYENTMDNTFLFFAIFMGLVSLILAALVRIHPIFIPLYLIGLIIVIFMSGIFSNIYQEIASNPSLSETAASLTFIHHLMVALPIIVGVFGTLLMIITYKLWSAEQ